MFNANVNEILRGYAVREHKDTGILIAEKQIFLPEKEIIMLDQHQGMTWDDSNSIILADNTCFMKGGRKL